MILIVHLLSGRTGSSRRRWRLSQRALFAIYQIALLPSKGRQNPDDARRDKQRFARSPDFPPDQTETRHRNQSRAADPAKRNAGEAHPFGQKLATRGRAPLATRSDSEQHKNRTLPCSLTLTGKLGRCAPMPNGGFFFFV